MCFCRPFYENGIQKQDNKHKALENLFVFDQWAAGWRTCETDFKSSVLMLPLVSMIQLWSVKKLKHAPSDLLRRDKRQLCASSACMAIVSYLGTKNH